MKNMAIKTVQRTSSAARVFATSLMVLTSALATSCGSSSALSQDAALTRAEYLCRQQQKRADALSARVDTLQQQMAAILKKAETEDSTVTSVMQKSSSLLPRLKSLERWIDSLSVEKTQ
jgi:hypothetical protein